MTFCTLISISIYIDIIANQMRYASLWQYWNSLPSYRSREQLHTLTSIIQRREKTKHVHTRRADRARTCRCYLCTPEIQPTYTCSRFESSLRTCIFLLHCGRRVGKSIVEALSRVSRLEASSITTRRPRITRMRAHTHTHKHVPDRPPT